MFFPQIKAGISTTATHPYQAFVQARIANGVYRKPYHSIYMLGDRVTSAYKANNLTEARKQWYLSDFAFDTSPIMGNHILRGNANRTIGMEQDYLAHLLGMKIASIDTAKSKANKVSGGNRELSLAIRDAAMVKNILSNSINIIGGAHAPAVKEGLEKRGFHVAVFSVMNGFSGRMAIHFRELDYVRDALEFASTTYRPHLPHLKHHLGDTISHFDAARFVATVLQQKHERDLAKQKPAVVSAIPINAPSHTIKPVNVRKPPPHAASKKPQQVVRSRQTAVEGLVASR
jgi:hypothetical protein